MSTVEASRCIACGFPDDDLRMTHSGPLCPYCRGDGQASTPAENIVLRPYQASAVASIQERLTEAKSTLVVNPTGTGKTIILASVIRDWVRQPGNGRVVVMAHRDELIRQAASKIEWVTGEPCDIEMGQNYADQCDMLSRANVVVTSVQTMSRKRRQERFHPADFGLLIIDEAHHAPTPTYKSVIDHFSQNAKLRLLGVTATADRADERAMGLVFDTVASEYHLPDAIDDGWLVPIEQQFVHVAGLDLSRVKTTRGGDLNESQLAEIFNEEERCHQIVAPTMEIAGDKQTLVFAVSVDQAEMMCDIANRHRPGCAEWICGDSVRCPMDVRRDRLRRFSAKQFQYLINCAVLLEGYDEPGVEVIACGRPTKSRSLYAQMVGRGTRPLPGVVDPWDTPEERRAAIAASGKPSLLVLDYVGNSGSHKLVHTGDILGGNYDDEIVAMATSDVAAKSTAGERTDMLAALRAAEEAMKERKRNQRSHLVATASYDIRRVNPFDLFDLVPRREAAWHRGRKPTPKMAEVVERLGFNPASLSFTQASQLIDEAGKRRDKGLCTFKQARILAKYGESMDVSFAEASRLMDAIKRNGWKPLPKIKAAAS
jgi:superfamily II DNA or RNA helicase